MLTRIVRMHIRAECVREFEDIFSASAPEIRRYPGCLGLKLLRDVDAEGIYMTLSEWQDAASLDAYRTSPLFQRVWGQARALFSGPAQAFSLEERGGR